MPSPNPKPNSPEPSGTPFWLPRNPLLRRSTLALMDGLMLAAGLAFNFVLWLRFRHGTLPPEYFSLYLHVVVPIVALRLLMFQWFGLYRSISRHAGNYELLLIASADTVATAIIVLFNFITPLIPPIGSYPVDATDPHMLRIPWGIVFSDWMLALIATAGVRILRREVVQRLAPPPADGVKRVLIVGAGDAGEQVARDLARVTQGAYRPVAYVDPNPELVGHKIHGVPVVGTLGDLPKTIAAFHADELVIALQRPTPRVLSEIVDHCRTARVAFKIVPTLTSVMSGGIEIQTLRPVEIEDLLGREPVSLDTNENSYLAGKRVLITGAGGSIGRELCRQCIAQKPHSIIMLGRGENSIFEALIELQPLADQAGVTLTPTIGDVRDENLVRHVFQEYRPHIVFHAAAHKHVHLMEAQPAEAIRNNVWGTRCVARAAREINVERFILISTDKAVRPTGIMGASKRVAEMIVSAINLEAQGAFLSVRFGNVLGSRGSVIPTFRRQIEKGGPVTVTHPDVTRYFMTIPEAVSLVIQAGAQGRGGELYILDMGKPVRIADLARNLITLSGLEPESDISIVFTGMRPGEKLKEELLTQDEGVTATENGKIFIARNQSTEWSQLKPSIDALIDAAAQNQEELIRELLHQLIPDYTPAQELAHDRRPSNH